jgi:hypothetical protein
VHLILVLSVLAAAGCASGREPARPLKIAFASDVERMPFTMIETLMAEFDREMEKAVRQHLIGWLL